MCVRGGGPAMTATIAGDTQFFFSPIAGMVRSSRPDRSGRLRERRTGDRRRCRKCRPSASWDAALNQAVGWFGLMAPAGTPASIVAKLSDVVAAASRSPERHHGVRAQGIEPDQQPAAGVCGLRPGSA